MYIFSITVYVGGSRRVPPDPTQSTYDEICVKILHILGEELLKLKY